MAGAATIAAVALAVVFAWAAVAKLVRHAPTVDAFEALGVPVPFVLSIVVPLGELIIAGTLIESPAVGAALALAALAMFTFVVARGIMAGSTVGCGCFGSRRVEPVSPADVIRNGLLAALAAVATGTHHLVRPGVAAVAAMVAVLVVAVGLQRLAVVRLHRPMRTQA